MRISCRFLLLDIAVTDFDLGRLAGRLPEQQFHKDFRVDFCRFRKFSHDVNSKLVQFLIAQ